MKREIEKGKETCCHCGIKLNCNNWLYFDFRRCQYICKNCSHLRMYKNTKKWIERNPEKCKQIQNANSRKWIKNHPEWNAEHSKKFRLQNVEVFRKYDKVKHHCKAHGLPSPHLRNEFWKGSKVRVSRKSNGQFISWSSKLK